MTFCFLGNNMRRRGKQKKRWNDMLEHKMFHRIASDRLEWEWLQEAYAQSQNKWATLHMNTNVVQYEK